MTSKNLSQESAGAVQLLKSLRILGALAELNRRGGVPLQQIADHLGQNKSSVYRWLQSFREYGFVEQDPVTERYRLGLKILELSEKLLSTLDLRTEAASILHDLVEQSGDTVHLGVYDRGEVVYLEKLDGRGSILMRSRVGGRMPAYCTGLGKAMLPYLPVTEVQSVVAKGLQPRTPNTITDPTLYLRHLEEIRMRGYSIDNEENELDVRCVAAPVFNHTGQLVASVSVACLASHLPDERVPHLAILVRGAGEALSARLGYRSASSV